MYEMFGEDQNGKIIGQHRSTGIGRPRFWDRALYFGEERRLAAALDSSEAPQAGCLAVSRPGPGVPRGGAEPCCHPPLFCR